MASCSAAWQDGDPLPDALQELLADLGASPWAASSSHTHPHPTYFNVDLSRMHYGVFFEPRYKPAAGEEKRWLEVRRQVLAAIGHCNTLKMIRLHSWAGIGEKGRVKEVEALWEGIEQASISNSSSLQELYLRKCRGLGSSEAACEALGGVLRHSRTLRVLDISGMVMDASGLAYLCSALGDNPNSALRVLDLSENKVGGGSSGTGPAAGGAVLVAALLKHTVCPSLQHLKMLKIGLDVEGGEVIGQALARNTTLRSLSLGREENLDAMVRLVRSGVGEPTENNSVIDLTAVSAESSIFLDISGMTDENEGEVEVAVWRRTWRQCNYVLKRVCLKRVMKKVVVDELEGAQLQGGNRSGKCSRGLSQDPMELEPIPVALQELVAELGGSQWPSSPSPSSSHSHTWCRRTELPDLSDMEYGSFFNCSLGQRLADPEEKRWRAVRLQVLTAIANCTTLHTIDMAEEYGIGEKGRTEEVEALWGGLASTSNYLETLYLNDCPGLGSGAACAALGSFLRRTPNLRDLTLCKIGMDADGLSYLRRGLEANPHSTLRILKLSGNRVGGGGAGGGAEQVAALLDHTVCPSLQHLIMDNIGLDVEGAQTIGEVLATNTGLRILEVGDDKEVGVLLRTGLANENDGTDCGVTKGNRSIIKLVIYNLMEGDISDVNLVLRTNQVLEDLSMSNCRLSLCIRYDRIGGGQGHKYQNNKLGGGVQYSFHSNIF